MRAEQDQLVSKLIREDITKNEFYSVRFPLDAYVPSHHPSSTSPPG